MAAQPPERAPRRWPWALLVFLVGVVLLKLSPFALILVAPAILAGAVITYRRSRDAEVRAVSAGVIAGSAVFLALVVVLSIVFALGAVATSGGVGASEGQPRPVAGSPAGPGS